MEIKNCIICGTVPTLKTEDMGKPNGRGYPGYLSYDLKCKNCGMVHVSTTDIYDDVKEEKAPERIIRLWNDKLDKIGIYLSHNKPKRETSDELKKLMKQLLAVNKQYRGDDETIHTECEKALLEYVRTVGHREAVEIYNLGH